MPLVIGVLKETHPGERRLSVVPDVVKKYQGLGASVVMQKDAAKGAHFRDTDFADVTWLEHAADVVAAGRSVDGKMAVPGQHRSHQSKRAADLAKEMGVR